MRHSHHTTGSTAAQSTLQTLAGWLPDRRGILGALLVASSATAATLACAAIVLPAAQAANTCAVSPKMAKLVEVYRSAGDNINALDPRRDEAAWTAAEANWEAAELALMNERPATVADFAVKFDTLLEVNDSEGEFARLKRLSEDANALAGCPK